LNTTIPHKNVVTQLEILLFP